jgi:hypothetical protein
VHCKKGQHLCSFLLISVLSDLEWERVGVLRANSLELVIGAQEMASLCCRQTDRQKRNYPFSLFTEPSYGRVRRILYQYSENNTYSNSKHYNQKAKHPPPFSCIHHARFPSFVTLSISARPSVDLGINTSTDKVNCISKIATVKDAYKCHSPKL